MPANYDDFPFEWIETQRLVQIMMDSFRIGDTAFALACRDELRLRPDAPAQPAAEPSNPNDDPRCTCAPPHGYPHLPTCPLHN